MSLQIVGADGVSISFAGTGDAFTLTNCAYCVLENFDMAPSSSNGHNGIVLSTAIRTILRKVSVWGFYQRQLVIDNNSNSSATYECVFTGLNGALSAVYHGVSSNVVLHDHSRFAARNGRPACEIADGTAISFINCDISGDSIAGSDGLVLIGGNAISLKNCYFEQCDKSISFRATGANTVVNADIDHCYFRLNAMSGVVGVNVSGNVANISIRGGLFFGDDPTFTSTAVVIDGYGNAVQHVFIDEHNFSEAVTTDVLDTSKRASNMWQHRFETVDALPAGGTYCTVGDMVLNRSGTAGQRAIQICKTTGYAVKENWYTGHVYVAGDYVHSSGDKIYRCQTGGTAGATEPTHTSGDASDGGVTWTWFASSVGAAVWSGAGQVEYRAVSGSPNVLSTVENFRGEYILDSTNGFWYRSLYTSLWGCETIKSGTSVLSSGSASVNLTTLFGYAMADTNYKITLSIGAGEILYWTNKTSSGFDIKSSYGLSSSTVDWTITRY